MRYNFKTEQWLLVGARYNGTHVMERVKKIHTKKLKNQQLPKTTLHENTIKSKHYQSICPLVLGSTSMDDKDTEKYTQIKYHVEV